ncbi:hypothetical protein GCM10027614_45190 [Micromonospora vulcania]
MARSRLRTAALAGVTALALLAAATPAAAAQPLAGGRLPTTVHDEQITFQDWSGPVDWHRGSRAGTRVVPGLRAGVTLARPAGTTEYADPHTGVTRSWEYGTWTSPVNRIGFDATELIASWNAETPAGTWIQVEMQGSYTSGDQTPWYVLGRWASGDTDIKRTSVNRQGDPWSTIWTDTFSIDDATAGVLLQAYQLRLTLYRAPGQTAAPVVRMLGAMSSAVPDRFTVTPSAGHIAWGRELSVPRYSQNVHAGHYPEYDGGGEAWCSPPPPRWWSSTGAVSRPRPTPPGWTRPTPTRRSTTPRG